MRKYVPSRPLQLRLVMLLLTATFVVTARHVLPHVPAAVSRTTAAAEVGGFDHPFEEQEFRFLRQRDANGTIPPDARTRAQQL